MPEKLDAVKRWVCEGLSTDKALYEACNKLVEKSGCEDESNPVQCVNDYYEKKVASKWQQLEREYSCTTVRVPTGKTEVNHSFTQPVTSEVASFEYKSWANYALSKLADQPFKESPIVRFHLLSNIENEFRPQDCAQ